MSNFSSRRGVERKFSNEQICEAIVRELGQWNTHSLFLKAFGGTIYFEDPIPDDQTREKMFRFAGQIENRDAFFRRGLVSNIRFYTQSGTEFLFKNLPKQLSTGTNESMYLLFDFLELIYPHANYIDYDSKKRKLRYSSKTGKERFRQAINPDLALAETPYQMLENGQIVEISNKPMVELAKEAMKVEVGQGIDSRTIDPIKSAAENYIKRGITLVDKKRAVRELADSLESIRPQIKLHLLSSDERDLFNIANGFAIRHNDDKQKSNYEKGIWYDWMFHVNLAALLTVIRIMKAQQVGSLEN